MFKNIKRDYYNNNDFVELFEQRLCEYTDAPYAVAVDRCTNAILLAMEYYHKRKIKVTLPRQTYLSVPMLMRHLDIEYEMVDEPWIGEYSFLNTRIWDSARRLERNMYKPGQFQCLSFGWSKPLQLGKVGAILLDDELAYKKFSRQRSDGRDLHLPWETETDLILGYHYCPTLELCSLGSALLPNVVPQAQQATYPDCRKFIIRE
jgi:dTDP-4-amino-4,6-dideoxygalactose transaminase